MRSLDSWMVGSLIRKSPMKKLATALALALAFAAPMAFSTSGAQASTVNSQSHMTKSIAPLLLERGYFLFGNPQRYAIAPNTKLETQN